MPEIQSIVILDLETTGLPAYSQNDTRITEMALVACEIDHLTCVTSSQLPRVLHKLVLCVNPRRKIWPAASLCSGLDNDMLENTKPFGKEIIQSIETLVARLPQPVCLIAHNGNRFDFPILKKEVLACQGSLPDMFCLDSLLAFRQLYPSPPKTKSKQKKPVFNYTVAPELEDSEDDLVCLNAIKRYEAQEQKTPQKTIQQQNEMTPKAKPAVRNLKFEETSETIELSDKSKVILENLMKPPNAPKKVLPNVSSELETRVEATYPKSYKLCDIYMFLHDKEMEDAHRAENDTLALLKCIVKSSTGFIHWMNENAVPLENIAPLV